MAYTGSLQTTTQGRSRSVGSASVKSVVSRSSPSSATISGGGGGSSSPRTAAATPSDLKAEYLKAHPEMETKPGIYAGGALIVSPGKAGTYKAGQLLRDIKEGRAVLQYQEDAQKYVNARSVALQNQVPQETKPTGPYVVRNPYTGKDVDLSKAQSARDAMIMAGYRPPQQVGRLDLLQEKSIFTVKGEGALPAWYVPGRGTEIKGSRTVYKQTVTAQNQAEARLAGLPGPGEYEIVSDVKDYKPRESMIARLNRKTTARIDTAGQNRKMSIASVSKDVAAFGARVRAENRATAERIGKPTGKASSLTDRFAKGGQAFAYSTAKIGEFGGAGLQTIGVDIRERPVELAGVAGSGLLIKVADKGLVAARSSRLLSGAGIAPTAGRSLISGTRIGASTVLIGGFAASTGAQAIQTGGDAGKLGSLAATTAEDLSLFRAGMAARQPVMLVAGKDISTGRRGGVGGRSAKERAGRISKAELRERKRDKEAARLIKNFEVTPTRDPEVYGFKVLGKLRNAPVNRVLAGNIRVQAVQEVEVYRPMGGAKKTVTATPVTRVAGPYEQTLFKTSIQKAPFVETFPRKELRIKGISFEPTLVRASGEPAPKIQPQPSRVRPATPRQGTPRVFGNIANLKTKPQKITTEPEAQRANTAVPKAVRAYAEQLLTSQYATVGPGEKAIYKPSERLPTEAYPNAQPPLVRSYVFRGKKYEVRDPFGGASPSRGPIKIGDRVVDYGSPEYRRQLALQSLRAARQRRIDAIPVPKPPAIKPETTRITVQAPPVPKTRAAPIIPNTIGQEAIEIQRDISPISRIEKAAAGKESLIVPQAQSPINRMREELGISTETQAARITATAQSIRSRSRERTATAAISTTPTNISPITETQRRPEPKKPNEPKTTPLPRFRPRQRPIPISRSIIEKTKIAPPRPPRLGSEGGGFNVLVKRKGKFKQLNVTPLPSTAAVKLGKETLTKTLAASVKIVDTTGKSIDTKSTLGVLGKAFRPGKKDTSVFVQKAPYRLSSRGERESIQAARKNRTGRLFA